MCRGGIAVAVAGAALAVGVVAGGMKPPPAGGQASAQPNVVVIQTDDQSLEMMRVMAHTNRLVGERGATFRNHFANWPLCCPSRATQLTGQYAHNHGVLGNSSPEGGYRSFNRHGNLAVWLFRAGYEVAHLGKYLNGYGPRVNLPVSPYNDVTELPPGWTGWRTGSAGTTYNFYGYTQNEASSPRGRRRNGRLVAYGSRVRDFKTDVTTADAVELIDRYAGRRQPFYLQVDYLAPHSGRPETADEMPHPPFDCGTQAKPAPRHATAFDDEPLRPAADPSFDEADVSDKPPFVREMPGIDAAARDEITSRYRCRLESVLSVDEGVRDIVRELRRAGELGSTYVLFTSDNGFFHGEHRIRAGKTEVYEPSIRIPLLLRGPGVPRGVTVNELTVNADLPATVMALSGAGSRSSPDGRSLIPAAVEPNEESGREILIETQKYTAIRTQRYKRVEYAADGFVELYDLRRDPSELENFAGSPAYEPVARALAARLAALRKCSGARCRLTPALRIGYEPRRSDCVKRSLHVRIRGADAAGLVEVHFFARGELAASDREPPFGARIARRELRGPGGAQVKTAAAMLDGRRVVQIDKFAVC